MFKVGRALIIALCSAQLFPSSCVTLSKGPYPLDEENTVTRLDLSLVRLVSNCYADTVTSSYRL